MFGTIDAIMNKTDIILVLIILGLGMVEMCGETIIPKETYKKGSKVTPSLEKCCGVYG